MLKAVQSYSIFKNGGSNVVALDRRVGLEKQTKKQICLRHPTPQLVEEVQQEGGVDLALFFLHRIAGQHREPRAVGRQVQLLVTRCRRANRRLRPDARLAGGK